MGNCAPSLSPPHVWALLGALWTDVLVYGLMCQLNQAPDWQVDSVEAQFSFRSGIDGLSFSYSGLSPWDLCPPWAGSLVFCLNKAQATSFKIVRTGIEVLFLLYCCYCSFEIKRSFGGKTVLCHCMCGWSLPFFYLGNL